jgi:hypothetical protein
MGKVVNLSALDKSNASPEAAATLQAQGAFFTG